MILELNRYGINAERKSIYYDIESLKIFGIDILCRKSKTYDYYIASRSFEPPELKLLADAVASSKFTTEKKSRELINAVKHELYYDYLSQLEIYANAWNATNEERNVRVEVFFVKKVVGFLT